MPLEHGILEHGVVGHPIVVQIQDDQLITEIELLNVEMPDEIVFQT